MGENRLLLELPGGFKFEAAGEQSFISEAYREIAPSILCACAAVLGHTTPAELAVHAMASRIPPELYPRKSGVGAVVGAVTAAATAAEKAAQATGAAVAKVRRAGR